MKETVLVTGGAGYIGSHTAVELIQAGFDVVIADNLSNSDLQAVEGVRRITSAEVPFEQIDCCDLQAMRRLFAATNSVRSSTSPRRKRSGSRSPNRSNTTATTCFRS